MMRVVYAEAVIVLICLGSWISIVSCLILNTLFLSQAIPQEITATPYDRIRAQNTVQASGNVVDVVNDKIIHGKEQFNIDRFTSLPKEAMSLQHMYQRQNSLSDGQLHGHPAPSRRLGSPHSFSLTPSSTYSHMADSSVNGIQNPTSRDSIMPQPSSTLNNSSLDSTNNNSNLSMVEHLLSADSFNDIQDLVSLLGQCLLNFQFCFVMS